MLNSKYVPLSSLGCYFVDKSSGLPLTNGLVYCYSDINRSQLKPVYEISGNPPDYTYTQISNPLILSGVGTFVDDSGNPIIPYGYPYDDEGKVENYFIQVYSTVEGVQSVLQESIPAWPNITSSSGGDSTTNVTNFIPNGQFLAHTDVPADELNDIPAGEITQPVTEIAYGNWTFERPETSMSTDNVQFFRYGQYVANPTASPRYAVQIQCFGADPSDAYKYLKVSFGDVNKFSSDTDQYTFTFTANTFSSADFTVGLNLIKFYGSGGSPSPSEVTQLTTFTVTASPQIFQFSFSFGANTGIEVGTNNDDYVALAISLPTNISLGGQFTDFALLSGSVDVTAFPATTNKDFDVRSVSADTPDYDGSSLYLPVILTKNGLTYDKSEVGRVYSTLKDFGSSSLSDDSNEMLCDGSQYLVSSYSDLGIPLRRLWNQIIFNQTLQQPLFGSGHNFVSSYIKGVIGSSAEMFLITNNLGAPTAPSDGPTPTGITFFDVFGGNSSGYGLNAYVTGSNTLVARATTVGYVAPLPLAPTIDTWGYGDFLYMGSPASGFTFTVNRNINTTYANITAPASKMIFTLTVTVPTTLASKYWIFNVLPGPTSYYMWFTVDGVGTDPMPSIGTAIQVNLKSTFSATDVAQVISSVLSGSQVYLLTFPAASSIPASSYWTFRTAAGNSYYVWYTVDGVGVNPRPSAILGINVSISSIDTANTVAQKTMSAINSTYYAAPDFRGLFLRGYDPTKIWDISAGNRFGVCPTVMGNMLGTFELDQLIAHTHTIPNIKDTPPLPNSRIGATSDLGGYTTQDRIAGGVNYGQFYTDNEGSYSTVMQAETGGVNANINWVIKY